MMKKHFFFIQTILFGFFSIFCTNKDVERSSLTMKIFLKNIAPFIILAVLTQACNTDSKLRMEQKAINEKAANINSDFRKIRLEVETLASEIKLLYQNQAQILPSIKTEKYQLASNGILSKPIDDGGSAVFVSGFYPINKTIREIVYFTEPIDSAFKLLVTKYPEIVQVYYNDKYSINRIYPFFDVQLQYEAKMDIPNFNFYYLADQKHNPEKKSLWVSEPYVDPAGRGWMVSAIAPVYFKDSLVGVPGIDVTINMLTKRFVQDNVNDMILIIDNSGTIVSAQEKTIKLLSFPPLFEHKYIETIKQDTYRKEQYNLVLSKDGNVRNIAFEILKNKKFVQETEIVGEKITIVAAHIPELDWYLLKILK
jgi:hypothetical protein